jgi:sugar-specific transcriptional regulator TrmB
VARANTYGALEGLVGRTAALRLAGRPARYRATDPAALIAQLAGQQGEALDRLSRSLRDASGPSEPETRSVTGGRAVANLIMQVVARTEGRAEGVLSAELLRPTLPAWRRAKERAALELRVAGEAPAEASPILSGTVSDDLPTVLLIDDVQTVLVAGSGETTAGMWSSHPAVAALARAWIRGLA